MLLHYPPRLCYLRYHLHLRYRGFRLTQSLPPYQHYHYYLPRQRYPQFRGYRGYLRYLTQRLRVLHYRNNLCLHYRDYQ